jgi:hypothetical protein
MTFRIEWPFQKDEGPNKMANGTQNWGQKKHWACCLRPIYVFNTLVDSESP